MIRTARLLIMISLFFIFLAFIIPLSFAGPPVQPKPTPSSKVPPEPRPILDDPKIQEFSANPARVVRGSNTVLKWKVEPGLGGSPITDVNIVRTEGSGPLVNIHSSSPTGEYAVRVPTETPAGRTVYTLTAMNRRGRSSVKNLTLEVTALEVSSPTVDLPPDLIVQRIWKEDVSHTYGPGKYYLELIRK